MQLVGKRTNVFVSYDHSVVEYISGFIGKKVAINQRCDDCFRVLMKQNKSENSLISKKEVYHLFHPRKECVDIVSRCERKLKSMSKKDFVKKNSFEYVRLQIVQSFFPENQNFFQGVNPNNLLLWIIYPL